MPNVLVYNCNLININSFGLLKTVDEIVLVFSNIHAIVSSRKLTLKFIIKLILN